MGEILRIFGEDSEWIFVCETLFAVVMVDRHVNYRKTKFGIRNHNRFLKKIIFSTFSGCIAPAIFGHKEIKKAMLCQLFGGSRKKLPDGMRLRGQNLLVVVGQITRNFTESSQVISMCYY